MPKYHSQTGFTIVEVFIAVVILTIAIFTLMASLTPIAYLEATSREFDIAKTSASSKLEEIKGYDFDSVCKVYSGTYFTVTGLRPPVGQPNPGYIAIDNSNPNLLDITITVTWQSGVKKDYNQRLQMKTMLTRSKN